MPEDQRRIILYGDSLLIEGVRAGLKTYPDLDIWEVMPSPIVHIEDIRALCPAVFIFDVSAIQPDFQLALFQQSGLLLVGIDAQKRQALVWSGRRAAVANAADLVSVIHLDD